MIDGNQDRQLNQEMPDELNSSGIFRLARYALGIEYRGTQYFGWQRQDNKNGEALVSVQLKVEEAIAKIANEKINIICAGRTDTGVHAREQVIHFDTHAVRPDKAWILGVNTNLPEDISVQWVKPVAPDFHARFSATARTYRYFINNQPVRSALSRELMTPVWKKLDHESMYRAAQCLLGEHDFSSFRGNSCQSKTPFKIVYHVDIQRSGAIVVLEIKANAFLHHMVRNIVGVLIKVGQGEKPVEWVREVLDAKDRRLAGVTAPSNGLFLMKVDYPERFQLPQLSLDSIKGKGDFEGMLAGNFC